MWRQCFWLAVFFLTASGNGFAQQKFQIRQYTSAEGLPQNSVKSIALDKSSFVWFSTEAGIVRFDGKNFQVYNHATLPEIIGDRFQNFFYNSKGDLFAINSYSALFKIVNNRPELQPGGKSKIPGYMIFNGGIPADIDFYAIDHLLRGESQSKWPHKQRVIIPLNSTEFLTIGREIIYKFRNTELVDSIEFNTPNLYRIFTVDEFIYFIDTEGIFYRLNPDEKHFNRIEFKCSNLIDFSSIEKEAIVWNYYNKTAFLKRNEELYKITSSISGDTVYCSFVHNQLPSNCIIKSVVYHPPSQSYLVGTDTKGLLIYSPVTVKNLPHSDMIKTESSALYSQVETDSNTIFTTYGLIISSDTTYKGSLPNYNAEGLLYTTDSLLYYSMKNNIYYRNRKGKIQHIPVIDEKGKNLPSTFELNHVGAFYEDTIKDQIYFGAFGGLGIIRNDTGFVMIQNTDKDINERANQILKVGKFVWVATCSGLTRYDEQLQTAKVNNALKGTCIRSLFNYGDYLFLGSYGNGFYILKGDSLKQMPLDQDGRLAQVHSFYLDKKGLLWISTNNGILLTSMDVLLKRFNDSKVPAFYYLLNQEDGILNPEFNGGCSPSVILLKNGYLSYPSMGGLVWIHPDSIKLTFPGNNLFFENIRVDTADVISYNPLCLKPDFRSLSTDLVLTYWGKTTNLQIEYRLKSTEKWEKLRPEERRLRFGNLPSGNYNLEVRVRHGFGTEDFYYKKLSFRVNEYFYEKTWLQILSFILLIGLIVFIVRAYNQNIIRKNQLLEKNIQDRTAQLKDSNIMLHENLLKLQESELELSKSLTLRDKLMSIISHDLVTPIRYISISSRQIRTKTESSPREELIQLLEEIDATTMRIYDNAQNVLHWIRFQSHGIALVKSNVAIHDLIDEVISIYKPIAQSRNTNIVNVTPEEDIIITDPRILKIVCQNIVNNAVKFTNSGEIKISSVTKGRNYHILIGDTGPGFSATALESIRQLRMAGELNSFTSDISEDGTHLGYQIIYELLRFLEGDFLIESSASGSIVEIILNDSLQETP